MDEEGKEGTDSTDNLRPSPAFRLDFVCVSALAFWEISAGGLRLK